MGEITDIYGQVKLIITVAKSRMKGKQFSRTVKLNSDTQRVLSQLVKKLKQHNRARCTDALLQSRQGYKGHKWL